MNFFAVSMKINVFIVVGATTNEITEYVEWFQEKYSIYNAIWKCSRSAFGGITLEGEFVVETQLNESKLYDQLTQYGMDIKIKLLQSQSLYN
ncbi:MAG: hypothetical protein QXG00_07860 [Candidatus Woesearchaeota archaeon]